MNRLHHGNNIISSNQDGNLNMHHDHDLFGKLNHTILSINLSEHHYTVLMQLRGQQRADFVDKLHFCSRKVTPKLFMANVMECSASAYKPDVSNKIYRSFRLCHPTGTDIEWELFSSKELFTAFNDTLESLPISTVVMLCRRHQDKLAYFLNFFDKSEKMANDTKGYIWYLCQQIRNIPIQWIIHHCLLLKDGRFATHIIDSAFQKAVIVEPHQHAHIKEMEAVWDKFKQITDIKSDKTYFESWKMLMHTRNEVKDLDMLKLSINLRSYANYKKNELAKRVLGNCGTIASYMNSLRNDMIPYCHAKGILHDQIVMSTIQDKRWSMADKLQIIDEFVSELDGSKYTLDCMRFRDNTELTALKEFAKKHKFEYIPDPNNYVHTPASRREGGSLRRCSVGRSSSVEFARSSVSEIGSAQLGLNLLGRSPSVSGFSHPLLLVNTMSALANGEPEDAVAYAEKLKKFSELSEIHTVFELAATHGLVFSLDELQDNDTKQKLLIQLVRSNDTADMKNYAELLGMTDDEVMETMNVGFDKIAEVCNLILRALVECLTRDNVDTYLEIVTKTIGYLLENGEESSVVCGEWLEYVHYALDFIDGRKLMHLVGIARSLHIIGDVEIEDADRINIMTKFLHEQDIVSLAAEFVRIGWGDAAECVNPKKPMNITTEQFVNAMVHQDGRDIVPGLTEVALLEKDIAVETLNASIPNINGLMYSRLMCIYALLEERGDKHERELNVLTLLQKYNMNIDFHNLNEDPEEELKAYTSEETIDQILSLAILFGIEDSILVHFITDIMSSRSFNDYEPFMDRIKSEESKKCLVEPLSKRLYDSHKVKLYRYMGCKELEERETIANELKVFGIPEYVKDEFLNDPVHLITTLYDTISIHEKYGRRLRPFLKEFGKKRNIDSKKIAEELTTKWINEIEKVSVTEEPSIYVEKFEDAVYRLERANIQKIAFVLRDIKPTPACKYLLKMIDEGTSYRAKGKALACLFATVEDAVISENASLEDLVRLQREVYYRSRMEVFNEVLELEEWTFEGISKLITAFLERRDNVHVGVFTVLFELCIDYKIENREILKELVKVLQNHRKYFLLKHFPRIFDAFPSASDDADFRRMFVEIISYPIDEIVSKSKYTRPFKPQHTIVLNYMFDALAKEPFIVDHLIIKGRPVSWSELVKMLISVGSAALAAEIGSFVTDPQMRENVRDAMFSADQFENALKFGFDKELIFKHVMEYRSGHATELLSGKNFEEFMNWLKKHNHIDTIQTILDFLTKQGRTGEVRSIQAHLNLL